MNILLRFMMQFLTKEFTKANLQGFKHALPIFLAYQPLGFAFGVLAVKSGIPVFYAISMSVLIFAGAGQFITAAMVGTHAPFFSIIIANLLINLRYFLMVAALLPFVKSFTFLQKILFSMEITDEIFAVHYAKLRTRYQEFTFFDKVEAFSINIYSHLGWIIGTALGSLSGELLTDIKPYGIDFALPAMFIALLVPLCLERLQLIVALISAILLLVFIMLGFSNYSLILASILAAAFGAYVEIKKENKALYDK